MAETRLILYYGSVFTIEWYYDDKGTSLAREFFLALNDDRKAALLALVKRLGDAGQIRDITKFRNEGDKIFAFKPRNYSAGAETVTLAPIKGRLCGAKRGGNNNCSAKIRHPRSGDDKKEYVTK
jgi:hypothetical protein